MNWEAIAAFGEVIGALAVVITLMYIARDIRQNSKSLSIATSSDLADNVDSSRSLVVEHRVSEDLSVLASIAGRRISIPGFAAWWKENSTDYDPEFVAWIDAIR